MKHEPLLRSVASGILIFLVTKVLTVAVDSAKKLDRVEFKMDEVYLRLDRHRARIDELDTRVRVCEIKQGDRNHGRN